MYSQFNDLARKFLTKMSLTFPQEEKVSIYKQEFDSLMTMIKIGAVSEDQPVKKFMYNMYDFGEKILRRDELFFKKDEFVNNAESISGKMGLIRRDMEICSRFIYVRDGKYGLTRRITTDDY